MIPYEVKFEDLYGVSRDRAHFTQASHREESEIKKQTNQFYIDNFTKAFNDLGMTCEEFEKSEISSYYYFKINGICMILDSKTMEFSQMRMLENGQKVLVDFLKNNNFIDIEFESPKSFQKFYKMYNLHLFLNDNLKGLNKLGIFEIKRFKDFL